MKKTILLITLLGIFLSTALSQDTSKLNLKEVTHYLIEGLECKEILIQRNKQLRTKDSVINLQSKVIDSTKQLTSKIKKDYLSLIEDNNECNKQYNKLADKHIKTKKVITGSIIINILLTCFLIL